MASATPDVMDIARPDLKQKKTRRLMVWAGVAVVVVAVAVSGRVRGSNRPLPQWIAPPSGPTR